MARNYAACLLACHRLSAGKAIRIFGRIHGIRETFVGVPHARENNALCIGVATMANCNSSAEAKALSVVGNILEPLRGSPRRFHFFKRFSSEAEEVPIGEQEMLNYSSSNVQYSSKMAFIPETLDETISCFRLLSENGQHIDSSYAAEFDRQLCLGMYHKMVSLQVMDTIFYEAQRQGRISFYVTTIGEEAINIASAAALTPSDTILSQYREAGVLLWRGYDFQQFADQCFGNEADPGKGRQMPAHYVSKEHNFFTVSSPIATQIPQAVGAAYSLKMNKENACAVTYFGDGGSSEGDFHAGMNFAAVLEVPLLFICRNNGWAISTPTSEQFRSDGVVAKGQAYGMRSLRVDGNDALAVYLAVKTARQIAVEESRPILIEALTYRVGHHSTSDDSSKYRSKEEIEHWRVKCDPVMRLRIWLQNNGWWNLADEQNLQTDIREKMMLALQNAETRKKPCLSNLFKDVYDSMPGNLKDQERKTCAMAKQYPKDYPSDVPLN